MVWDHLILIETPHALSEEIVVLAEDPTGPNVHQGLGMAGFGSHEQGVLPEVLGPAVLLPDEGGFLRCEYKLYSNIK